PTRVSEQKAFTAVIPETKISSQKLPAKQMKINNNATILASSESDVRVTRSSKKNVATEMNQGSAMFSIEPNQYKSFQVNTPDAEITVTGTIFDVLISGNTTRVSVIRGSVSVFYKSLKAKISLSKNETVQPESGRAIVKTLTSKEKAELSAYLEKITATALEEKQTPLTRIAESVPAIPLSQVLEQKLTLGLRSLNEKDYPTALSYFNEIKASGLKNSTMQTACFESALLLLNKMGRKKEGLKAMDEYLRSFSQGLYKEEALVEIIAAHRTEGNPDKIIQYEKEYVEAFPEKDNSCDFSYEIATLQRESKKAFPEAALSYSEFIRKCPKDFRVEDAFFWQGKCDLFANNPTQAHEVFSRYLNTYPEGRWVNDIKTLLKQ
ncbi:MAG: FecR domain-containing protein, partial [Candidatus Omnitrophica bacterium]|nr:FecR domain-containing protein [Candidatus Omnitrophota bacterium]